MLRQKNDFPTNSKLPHEHIPQTFQDNYPMEDADDYNSTEDVEDEEVVPPPTRKIKIVKSLPVYRGFSAPAKYSTAKTRCRKYRNKYTIGIPTTYIVY